MLKYEEALNFIHDLNRFGTKLGLHNITNLLEILGNPHKNLNIIHVAGTNGKGSTCAMIDSILRAQGYKVGLYTSPYLEVFNERIRVNGENIPDEDIARLTQKVKDAMDIMKNKGLGSPTEFEVVTALGFLYFEEQAVDFLVLEVGMGGRLDATNVANPLASVITSISFDHQQYLGNTISDIAREKCGIIKPGKPVISSPQAPDAMEVIEDTCKERGCYLLKAVNEKDYVNDGKHISYKFKNSNIDGQNLDIMTKDNIYRDISINLLGYHQLENAATAVGLVEALKSSGIRINNKSVYVGLKHAKWPGRLEILSKDPIVLIDGAHNVAGIESLKNTITALFDKRKIILVLGILEDKDVKQMVANITDLADIIITTAPDSPRALTAEKLAKIVRENTAGDGDFSDMVIINNKQVKLYTEDKLQDAVNLALNLADPADIVVFAGSLYLIGAVRTILTNMKINQK